MLPRAVGTIAGILLSFTAVGSASALTSKECSTKFQAAKQAGTLNGQKWSDFRKAECGPSATAEPAAKTIAVPAPAPATPPATTAAKPTIASKPTAARSATTAGAAKLYPPAIDPKYAGQSAGKARVHTCLDAYNAAKASGTLGAMKWIEKGGGYYSACNAKLKGG